MRRLFFVASIGAAGLIAIGMSSLAGADESSRGADLKQEQQIREQLHNAWDLGNNRITVTVDDGIAVLEGTVDSQQEKKEAQQLAHVDGILGVNNRLQVRAAGK